MKDRLCEALKGCRADYADIRFEQQDGSTLEFRGPETENVSSGKSSGGIVRACTRGGWGYAAFDSLDELATSVAEACEAARMVGKETTELAPTPQVDQETVARLERDFRGVSFDEKLELVRRYNDIILGAGADIRSSSVAYADSFRTVWFASTEGGYFREDRPRVLLRLRAVARKGSLVQYGHDGASSPVTFDAVTGLEQRAEAAAREAMELLHAPPVEAGPYTVVLDPELGGVFAHEAFGHLSEADFIYENAKMRSLMHLGRPLGVKALNIVDDGTIAGLLGTAAVDDEGTPTTRTHLVRDGVLAGHLHSRETAAKMGASPTGNARALDRTHAPIVRMTNTLIANGTESFESLIGGIDRGLYCCGALGGQTMMEMFTFSARTARRIEGGRLGPAVRDVVLTGNVFETLGRIDGVGNDLRIIQKGGGCGKGEQSPLPVTFGSPHLRIRDVVIGGR